jgi:DNA invertase Pin-like site-specific DNA recombinase
MANTITSPTKAILYTRVSTGKQAASGLGLEAQIAACHKLAEARGLAVIDVQTDPAISGKDDIHKRPGLQKVIELAAKREDTVVIVYSLSRLSRRQSLTWQLLDERGAYRLRVVSATEPFDASTSIGRMLVGMLAIFAQLEADMCSERTSAALEARRARGFRLGVAPLSSTAPATVLELQRLYATGEFSVQALCAEADRRGLKSLRGKPWQPTQMRRTLVQTVEVPEPVLAEESTVAQ